MIPILIWNLRQRKWSILWWSIGIGAGVALYMLTYPSFRDQAAAFDSTLQQMPLALRSFISDNGNADILSPIGFLSSRMYYMVLPLLFSIFAIQLGSSLIAKEEQNHTLDLLLARPVSRSALLIGKALCGLISIGIVTIATLLVMAACIKGVNIDVPLTHVAQATLIVATLGVVFGAIAFLVSAIGKTARISGGALASLIAIGGYIISSLDSTVTWLKVPAKLLPYEYYHPRQILEGNFTWGPWIGMLAAIAALGMLSWIAFRRRDIA